MTLTVPALAVRWWPSTLAAREALTSHAYAVRGPATATSGHLCPECGSSEHGRPWLRHDGHVVAVSLSRSGPHLVTVLAQGPVGVDVESIDAIAGEWHPELVCTAPELADPPSTPREMAAVWVAKEAILKHLGSGLSTPMTEVPITAYDVRPIQAPPGYVAAVCTGRAGRGRP